MTNYTIILKKQLERRKSNVLLNPTRKLWEEEKNEQDKFSKTDMELVLCKDDEIIDDYEIIDAQREWIVID